MRFTLSSIIGLDSKPGLQPGAGWGRTSYTPYGASKPLHRTPVIPFTFTFLLFLLFTTPARAQMWNGTDTLYGNEWIDYGQQYFKIMVAEDGIYRISYETLQNNGLPVNTINGSQYQLWRLGEEQPLYITAGGPLAPGDFIEFYGQKNRSELDRYLFQDPDNEMLNPWYSLFTDTAAYFLTWVEPGEPTLRYEEVENELVDLPEKEEWFMDTVREVFSDALFFKKYDFQDYIGYSYFDEGEGFASRVRKNHSFRILADEPAANNSNGILRIRLVSSAGASHLKITVNGNILYEDNSYPPYRLRSFEFPIENTILHDSLNIQVEGVAGDSRDGHAIAGLELVYPRRYVFSSAVTRISLPPGPNRRYLEIDNPALAGGGAVFAYDVENEQRMEVIVEGGKGKLLLPPRARRSNLWLIGGAASGVVLASDLEKTVFEDYSGLDASYLILTHSSLMDNNSPGGGPIRDYADFRASEAGGGFEVAVVPADKLYEQYAYGLDQHPLAIRNFGARIEREWRDIRYVFLIGKGYEYRRLRAPGSPLRAVNLVPAFGEPGSDNLLFAPPGGSEPRFAVGRLAAKSKAEIRDYLNKVETYEAGWRLPRTVDNYAWKKRILHLAGANGSLQTTIGNLLGYMEKEAEENKIGATVATYFKESTDPVAGSINSAVIKAVEDGVLIKTFMGHGGIVNTDFAIDDPEVFDNAPRYPLIFSLGCLTGNVFTPENSVSEAFTLAPGRGGVAYIASSGYGEPFSLETLSRRFYALAGGDMYGRGIGEIMKAVRASYENNPTPGIRALVDQLHLHGDPAIRVNDVDAPDYTIDFKSARIEPGVVNTLTGELAVSYTLVNIGAHPSDTLLFIRYEHELPNGEIRYYLDSIVTTGSFTQAVSTLPFSGEKAAGINFLRITIDPDNRITELPGPEAEENNKLSGPGGEDKLSFFVYDNTARPVFPPEFGIAGTETGLELVAASSDVFAEEKAYQMEIDTTQLFNSSRKQQVQLTADGGLIRWAPDIPLTAGTAYYWRVSQEDANASDTSRIWESSSFVYLPGYGEGWSQGHYFQFLDNDFDRIELGDNRQFSYSELLFNVIGRAVIISSTNNTRSRVFLNSDRVVNATNQPSLNVIAFHPLTGSVWDSRSFRLSGANQKRAEAVAFIREGIPEGYWVVALTFHSPGQSFGLDEWAQDSIDLGDNIATALRKEGAVLVDNLYDQGPSPYIFAFRKGIGPIAEDLAPPGEENANIFFNFPVLADDGSMWSGVIGPALEWKEGHFNYPAIPRDSIKVNFWGMRDEQAEPERIDFRIDPAFDPLLGYTFEMGNIDARQYPYLKLQLRSRDSLNRVAPQLERWGIHFKPAPDLALDPVPIPVDTLQEGAEFGMQFSVANLSGSQVDSVKARYTILTAANQQISWEEYLGPVPGQGAVSVSLAKNTISLAGLNRLFIEINPDRSPMERNYQNNVGSTLFYVRKDKLGPVLDVTFDGQHIIDGDLVSSAPLITISLQDENQFLTLGDTSLFRLRLQYPSGIERPINFSEAGVAFFPAQPGRRNRATIEWQPRFEEDGEYKLMVQGRDASGNSTGEFDYSIRFEVINKKSISQMLPYPNPFSTSTRFLYTLTGSQEPDQLLIRIMTTSGRVVREITREEFGPMKIGTHLSDFVWDGTDNFGDRLANGVYLYQVITRDANGEEFEEYENEAISRYFRQDIGKIVILR